MFDFFLRYAVAGSNPAPDPLLGICNSTGGSCQAGYPVATRALAYFCMKKNEIIVWITEAYLNIRTLWPFQGIPEYTKYRPDTTLMVIVMSMPIRVCSRHPARSARGYDLMSRKYFTHATPTLFNSGTGGDVLGMAIAMGRISAKKRKHLNGETNGYWCANSPWRTMKLRSFSKYAETNASPALAKWCCSSAAYQPYCEDTSVGTGRCSHVKVS